MKKILSLILILGLLLTGSVVFANGTATALADTTTSKAAVRSKLSVKLKDFKSLVAELKPQTEEIRSNRAKFAKLKAEAKTAYNAAKSQVKEMLKNKDSMTPSQIDAIKQAVSTLANDKRQLGSTEGNINSENLSLKTAKKDKNLEAYKQALNNIITIQTTRISNLTTIIEDINKITAM